MESNLSVAMVEYHNTLPFLYAFKNSTWANSINLIKTYPSACFDLFKNKEVDMALVPVAPLIHLKDYYIITDYCIGTLNKVHTVGLFSDVPIQEVKTIYLDFDSMTSVELSKILLTEYWDNTNVEFKSFKFPNSNFKKEKGVAYLMIGDKVFHYESMFKFNYDLGEAWHTHTGLPFVFAVWVSRQPHHQLVEQMNDSFNDAVLNISQSSFDFKLNEKLIRNYLTNNIYFRLNSELRSGLELFFEKLKRKERNGVDASVFG